DPARKVPLELGGTELSGKGEPTAEADDRLQRILHPDRGAPRGNGVGFRVDEPTGVLGMERGHRRDAGLVGEPADVRARDAVTAGGECGPGDDEIRSYLLQPS